MIEELERKYSANNYAPLPVTFVRDNGCYLFDDRGEAYLDMLGAYSAASFGHCHPRLVAAVRHQMGVLDITSRAVGNDVLGKFLARSSRAITVRLLAAIQKIGR